MSSARETFGSPGISIMAPAIATTNPAPAESEVGRCSFHPTGAPNLSVVGERILRFRDADGQLSEAERVTARGFFRTLTQLDVVGAVDLLRDGCELLDQGSRASYVLVSLVYGSVQSPQRLCRASVVPLLRHPW